MLIVKAAMRAQSAKTKVAEPTRVEITTYKYLGFDQQKYGGNTNQWSFGAGDNDARAMLVMLEDLEVHHIPSQCCKLK